jgi:hypothetical protein
VARVYRTSKRSDQSGLRASAEPRARGLASTGPSGARADAGPESGPGQPGDEIAEQSLTGREPSPSELGDDLYGRPHQLDRPGRLDGAAGGVALGLKALLGGGVTPPSGLSRALSRDGLVTGGDAALARALLVPSVRTARSRPRGSLARSTRGRVARLGPAPTGPLRTSRGEVGEHTVVACGGARSALALLGVTHRRTSSRTSRSRGRIPAAARPAQESSFDRDPEGRFDP